MGAGGALSVPQTARARAVHTVAALVAALVLAAYAGLPLLVGPGANRAFWEDLLQASTLLAATSLLFVAARGSRAANPRGGRAWFLLGLASLLYNLADWVGLFGGIRLDASAMAWGVGLLYFASYPIFLAGIMALPGGGLTGGVRRQIWFDTAITAIAAALVLWLLVLAPGLSHGTTTLGRGLVALLFPIGSLMLFWALYGLLFYGGAGVSLPSRLLAASVASMILSDLGYTGEVIYQNQALSIWVSAALALSHVLLGWAAALQVFGGLGSPPESPAAQARPSQGVRTVFFSAACLVVTLALLFGGHLDPTSKVALALVVLLVILFLIQQAVTLREETRLRGKLQQARDELEGQVATRTEELDRKLREVTTLSLAAGISTRAEEESALISETTSLVRECLFPDICGVLLVDAEAKVLRSAASFHWESGPREVPPIPLGRGVTGKVALSGRARLVPDTLADPDFMGLDAQVRSELCVPIRLGDEVIGVFNTESRKPGAFSESDLWVLNALASQMAVAIGRLRSAAAVREREARFRALIQNSEDIVTVHEKDRAFAYQSPSLQRVLGYTPRELEGRNPLELVHPEDFEVAKEAMVLTLKGVPLPGPVEFRVRRKNGSWAHLETFAANLSDDPAVKGIVLNSRDISQRKASEIQIRRQLERLKALRAIDTAIGATSDLRHTLQVVLDQVARQLGVDGAGVLLLDPATQTFSFAAGRGFRTDLARRPEREGEHPLARRAVRERAVVQVPDLLADPALFAHSPLFREEMFAAYFAAPLLAKSQVLGVLEVYHRRPLHPDAEWVDFFETLAGQAALALDNSALFENLQRSNANLALAYDVTLQGWSHALELRDQETQGHTVRVTDLTVRLARLAGVPEVELAHVRRGALLHDIGKMGIPDAILLKPGPLTPEEWVVMKRHVDYAEQLLSPIEFLRPSLDIPAGHHERWDGSGYPRGLKGESIPLAARVFAVVDNWDALSYSRPYRGPWPQEKVRAYLEENAGILFDPKVVGHFLTMELPL